MNEETYESHSSTKSYEKIGDFSKDQSPTKIGRRYELQRKIDEELRKLQLADGMESQTTADITKLDEVAQTNGDLSQKNEVVEKPPLLDNDPNNHVSNGCLENDHGGIKSNREDTSLREVSENDIERQIGGSEVDDVNEVFKEHSEAAKSPKYNDYQVTTTDSNEVVIPDTLSVGEAESDSVSHSSAMTSPSTTAGTFTLPVQSPETEADLVETLPIDSTAAAEAFDEPLVDTVSPPSNQIPQESTMAQDTPLLIDLPDTKPATDGGLLEPLEPDQGSSVDPNTFNKEIEFSEVKTENALLSFEQENQNIESSSNTDESSNPIVLKPQKVAGSQEGGEVSVSGGFESAEESSEMKSMEYTDQSEFQQDSKNLSATELPPSQDANVPVELLLDFGGNIEKRDNDPEINEEFNILVPTAAETLKDENSPSKDKVVEPAVAEPQQVEALQKEDEVSNSIDFDPRETLLEEENAEDQSKLPNDLKGVEATQRPLSEGSTDAAELLLDFGEKIEETKPESPPNGNATPANVTQDEVVISEQGTTDDSTTDRIVSTDEEEFSGYDIDMDPTSSFQEEINVLEEDTPIEFEITKACDKDDVPLFADVKYSVGQQISNPIADESHKREDNKENTPTQSEDEYPPEAPWNSSGQLVGCNTQVESFPSDKADSAGTSSRSDISSDFDEEISTKIAEETVSNAIQAAYEICSCGKYYIERTDLGSKTEELPKTEARGYDEDGTQHSEVDPQKAEEIERPNAMSYELRDDKHSEAEPAQAPAMQTITVGSVYEIRHISAGDENVAPNSAEIDNKENDAIVSSSSSSSSENEGDEMANKRLTSSHSADQEKDAELIPQQGERDDYNDNSTSIDTMTVTQGAIEEYGEEGLATGVVKAELDANKTHDAVLSDSIISPQESVAGGDISEKAITSVAPTISVETANVVDEGDVPSSVLADNQEIKTEEESESTDDMVKVQDSSGHTRDLPERITYNPALSQRNTEATKWFGQPTSENKIWMKPSGKIDRNAEIERKRLIKAMTRRNNPNLVPKWEPPKEKDFTEDLDEKQKASLKKYEERRRSRISTSASASVPAPVHTESTSSTETSIVEETQQPSTKNLPRENIVIESVVHSKDAISVWESRLSEKQQKEQLEKQRLSVGKLKRGRERASSDISQLRQESTSSIASHQESTSSTASTTSALPTSEHIQRDSMDISEVRNRWKSIEDSNKVKPDLTVKKEKSGRRSTFTLNTPSTFRSFQSPTPAAPRQSNVVPVNSRNAGPSIRSSSQVKESFIDKEIREAAEREEKWKHEQWEKMSEISAASSEEVFTEATPSSEPKSISNGETQLSPRIDVQSLEQNALQPKSSPRDSSKGSSVAGSDTSSPPAQQKASKHLEVDSESLSSYGSLIVNPTSPPSSSIQEKYESSSLSTQDATDSGIDESNVSSLDAKIFSTTEGTSVNISYPKDDDQESEAKVRRNRIASLTSAVTPKGWERTRTRSVGPVSPVSPVHRSVSKPEVKKPVSPKLQPVAEDHAKTHNTATISSPQLPQQVSPNEVASVPPADLKIASTTRHEESKTEPLEENGISTKQSDSVPKPFNGRKKGGPIFTHKSGGPVEVSSSKSQLPTIMAREMEDAAAREAEWRNKQLELVNKGVDVSGRPVVHSTREIRTPTGAAPPPPVNSEQDNGVKLRRPVKSLFDDDEEGRDKVINPDASDEYKKREVVKAMRVPKRKSLLAMRWEEGQFQNTVQENDE